MAIRILLLGLSCCLLTLWAGLAGADSVSQDPDPTPPGEVIRLPDALQTAIRQSPTLESARIDLDIADAAVIRSLGIDDLLLRATGSYSRQANEAVAGNIVATNSGSQAELGVDLIKFLPTGGTLSLHVGNSRRSSSFASVGMEFTEFNTDASVRFEQPLLRGRGKSISHAGQKQAKHNMKASELRLRAQARDEIQQILEAYWELVWTHKSLEIRRSALTLAKERRRITESAIRLGSAPATALLEVDQVIATSEEEILLAAQRITVRSLEVRQLTGMEIGPGHLDLNPAEELNVSTQSFDLNKVVGLAMDNDPNLAAFAEQGQSAEIAVRLADNSAEPRLDLMLFAGPLGTADKLQDSISGVAKLKGYVAVGSLTFEQSLGKNNAKGQAQDSRAQRRQLAVNERSLRAQVATAAAASVQSAHIAMKRMELSQLAIGLSEKNIEAERRRFESGKSTNFDVLERQDEQKQARLRYARAAIDYLRATIQIHALSGELLNRYGVKLDS
jgi:outer membrane protein TolC